MKDGILGALSILIAISVISFVASCCQISQCQSAGIEMHYGYFFGSIICVVVFAILFCLIEKLLKD